MLSVHGRKPARRFVDPIAEVLLRAGLTPNATTLIGTGVAILLATMLIPSNHLVAAAIFIGIFSVLDMVDGTMARLQGGGTAYGATLDASCDRLTDGALFGALVFWLVYVDGAPQLHVAACLVVLVLSQVISYIKARGEAGGLAIVGGLVERPERLIVALVGLGLEGFGVPHAVEIAVWILLVGSVVTVVQRLMFAAQDPRANEKIAPPSGA